MILKDLIKQIKLKENLNLNNFVIPLKFNLNISLFNEMYLPIFEFLLKFENENSLKNLPLIVGISAPQVENSSFFFNFFDFF